MAPSSLLIAAIHNGELGQAPAGQLIHLLEDLTPRIVEVSDQPSFTSPPNAAVLRNWRRSQSERESQWAAYLGRSRSQIRASLGRNLFDLRIGLSKSARTNAWHIRQVEQAVTAKHVRAWQLFYATGEDELLVLESDATATNTSHDMVRALLDHPSDSPRYVNLAGGLEPEDIGIAHLRTQQSAGVEGAFTYRKPVTNTSCAYLVNRAFVEQAVEHLRHSPDDASLGIDWLFNAIFMERDASGGVTIECLHAHPPAIGHGSIIGVTRSWHPGR